MWHEFDADRMRADMHTMSTAGLRTVRTLLPWDVCMPVIGRVGSQVLRNVEIMLVAAEEAAISVIPVVCAQSVGDCTMLPPYAIDVSAPRRGVRCVSGGVVQPGGPRDQYTDPRMLEAQMLWIGTMLDAFGGNPAIAMWDLGHDPASTMRPRRIDDLRRWVTVLAERVHESGERCMLSLGALDVLTARGVRLDAAASTVDALGLVVDIDDLHYAPQPRVASAFVFLAQLAMRLAGAETPLHVHVSTAKRDSRQATIQTDDARRLGGSVTAALVEAGCGGVHAAAWSDCGPRRATLPPFDQHPGLMRCGVVHADGRHSDFGEAWLRDVTAERSVQPSRPWPEQLSVSDYYANLPHSVDDLFASWEGVAKHDPGMLG
ncbi:MAG: hypothetical protein JOY80_03575 [Candidatus Dormibacteraeota bacterium]|nr:hypothetical protein [Candidatus Dormibacteraeota bacterium]